MKITVMYRKRLKNMEPDYNSGMIMKEIIGKCATECMGVVKSMKYNNDIVKYTPIEIIDVED